MGIVLYYSGYYTHFSFVLCILSLMLPFSSSLKFFLLLNSIIVGIIGNLLAVRDFDTYQSWYKTNYPTWTESDIAYTLNIGNFICHTVPMILALTLLPFCTTKMFGKDDIVRFFLLDFGMFLLWSLLPFQNKIGADKVNSSYPSTNFLMAGTVFVCFFFFYMLYFLGKK